MNCHKCGQLLKEGAKFCKECGTPVVRMDYSTCPNCNNPVEKTSRFCAKCGAKVAAIESSIEGIVYADVIAKPPLEPASKIAVNADNTPTHQITEDLSNDSNKVSLKPYFSPPPRSTITDPDISAEQHIAKSRSNQSPSMVFIITGIIILLASAAIGGFFILKRYQKNSFGNRIETALSKNQIFDPPGACVADILAEEKAKDPTGKKITEYSFKVKAQVEMQADKILSNWRKDSDPNTNWDELEKEYNLLTSLFPDDNEIVAKLNYVYAQKAIHNKDYNQAREYYQKALDKKANWALPLNGLGKVYVRNDSPFKDTAIAIDYYQKAINADPKFTWSYVNLSFYYRQLNNFETAKYYMQKAIETYPTKSSLYKAMGDIYIEMKNYYEADLNYRKALEYETDLSAREELARTIERIGSSRVR